MITNNLMIMTKRTESELAIKYPNISRFVEEEGWIEIGDNEMTSAFVRAYNEGGTVYEGKSSYLNLDKALEDLDKGIEESMKELGFC
jgi:hypothetical protein